ncbi:TSUP family transporter [Helicobacter sp. 13S00401-1]|uniref:TSUP family transporter n=1 Tax=Helicobacter sp. 13S00401-1 TaxID=1905758 RepID=UPI000BA6C0F7|nr:TSUP family transporter [Helicobacter sp. 13S00401-1]
MDIWILVILAVIFFLAGFIDSIAGGGGLLTMPSLLLAGISPEIALGTNKSIVTLGTLTALINFIRHKLLNYKAAIVGSITGIIGAFFGAKTVLLLDTHVIYKVFFIILPIALILTLIPKKNSDKTVMNRKDIYLFTPIIALVVGFYDGFFGPGTGSFLILGFSVVIGLNLVHASALAKAINLSSNIGSLVTFILAGKIMYAIILPLIIANMLGGYAGSSLVIRKGQKIVKIFMLVVFFAIFISLIYKYLKGF